tara:strand:+ start:612 stop:968 length:357 start_codon:yes stop_codon:yes gene_type:complete
MIKKVLTLAAVSALTSPVFAGFYGNAEFNQTNNGSEWGGNGIDLHVGYEGIVGEKASFYLQGGPYVSNPSVGKAKTNFSGKLGGGYDITEKLNGYGEFSLVTDTTNTYGTKVGLKYKF